MRFDIAWMKASMNDIILKTFKSRESMHLSVSDWVSVILLLIKISLFTTRSQERMIVYFVMVKQKMKDMYFFTDQLLIIFVLYVYKSKETKKHFFLILMSVIELQLTKQIAWFLFQCS